jgi:hypothetical protein
MNININLQLIFCCNWLFNIKNNCIMKVFSFLHEPDLWSGFIGNIIGALIGGLIAICIVRLQIMHQKKLQENKENQANIEKELQLLWQIYLDIKKDTESSKLWDNYFELLKKPSTVPGSPIAQYINETLKYLMNDIRNFFKLLSEKAKENQYKKYNELDLLWERAWQLLSFILKVQNELNANNMKDESTLNYYKEAYELYQIHKKNSPKK